MHRIPVIVTLALLLLSACAPNGGPVSTAIPAATATLVVTSTPLPTLTATPMPVEKLAFSANESDVVHIYTINSDGSDQARVSTSSMAEGTFDYSPDGLYIAFEGYEDAVGNSEIYIMRADGTDVKRLTHRTQNDWGPVWSPDGSKILFTSDLGNHNWEIYVMNADGSGLIDLSNSSNLDIHPVWSPDGARIAYESGPYEELDADVFDGQKSAVTNIVVKKANGSGKVTLPLSKDLSHPSSPEWSPDGSQIAFECSGTVKVTAADGTISLEVHKGICTAGPDGASVSQVYDVKVNMDASNLRYSPDPVWSPDGSRIAFVGLHPDTGKTDIYTMKPDGSDVVQLTESPVELKAGISWSPDGKTILFRTSGSSLINPNIKVYVMLADGSDLHQLLGPYRQNPVPKWIE